MLRLFVYGTLKKGFHNHHFLKNAKFIDTGIIQGNLLHLGGFPGLIVSKSDKDYVQGELYEIAEETLPALDRLEGHPDFFRRLEGIVYLDGDDRREKHTCLVYQFQPMMDPEDYLTIWTGKWEMSDDGCS